MSKYVQYQTSDDEYIWIEVEEGDETFVEAEGARKDRQKGSILVPAARATLPGSRSLANAIEQVRPVINAVYDQVDSFAVRPDEINLNLGLKFTAKVGVVLAKAGTEGTMNIGIKWKLKDKAD